MRKHTILMIAVAAMFRLGTGHAQDLVTDPNVEYRSLEKRYEKQLEATQHEKKKLAPATWVRLGDILQEIYIVDQRYLNVGLPASQVTLFYKEPNETLQGVFAGETVTVMVYDRKKIYISNNAVSGWKITKMVTDMPLIKAFDAYQKAIELDSKGKLASKLTKKVESLKFNIERDASIAFIDGDYNLSVEYFDAVIQISKSPALKGSAVDSAAFYNAGLAANNAEMYERAIGYFKKAKEIEYGGGYLYFLMAKAYESLGDTILSLGTLQEGFKKHPDEMVLVRELINFYLSKNQTKEALEYIAIAKAEDPENASLFFAEGSLHDRLDDKNKAIESYLKAISLNPDYFDPYYNLGVVYFNMAVELYTEASSIPPREQKRYEETIERGNVKIIESLPYLEKAMQIAGNNYISKPNDAEALKTYKGNLEILKTIYFRLRNINSDYHSKLDEIDKKLEQL